MLVVWERRHVEPPEVDRAQDVGERGLRYLAHDPAGRVVQHHQRAGAIDDGHAFVEGLQQGTQARSLLMRRLEGLLRADAREHEAFVDVTELLREIAELPSGSCFVELPRHCPSLEADNTRPGPSVPASFTLEPT